MQITVLCDCMQPLNPYDSQVLLDFPTNSIYIVKISLEAFQISLLFIYGLIGARRTVGLLRLRSMSL